MLTEVTNYDEQLVLSSLPARELAANSIRTAQHCYKEHYNKKSRPVKLKVGEWVFVHFPQVETGKQHQLS